MDLALFVMLRSNKSMNFIRSLNTGHFYFLKYEFSNSVVKRGMKVLKKYKMSAHGV